MRVSSYSKVQVMGLTKIPIQWILGVAPPGVKRLQREGNHSPHSSVELKNWWSSFSTPPPPICMHGMQRDNFTLLVGK